MSMEYFLPMDLLNLETFYDSFNKAELEKQLQSKNTLDFAQLFLLLWDKKYEEVISYSESIWDKQLSTDNRAFVLQAAVAACELLFHKEKRSKILQLWSQCTDLNSSHYAQVIYFYHRGLTYFYDGALEEALKVWERGLKIAKQINYKRGQFRLFYHIGLAHKELNNSEKATVFFEESLMLAQKSKAHRFTERIETNLRSIKLNINFYTTIEEQVFCLLKERKLKDARKLILSACLLRRKEKRSWESRSEYILLALNALAFNNRKRFDYVFKRIKDEYIQLHTLLCASSLFPDLDFIKAKRTHLNFLLFSEEKQNCEKKRKTNCRVPNIDDVENFVTLLKANPNGVSKDLICSTLWNLIYDPVVHENRIYKLIMNTRKYFGVNQSVLNRYGGKYLLNSDFF